MSRMWKVALHLLIVLTLGPQSSASEDIGTADNKAANATTVPSSAITSTESSITVSQTTKKIDSNYVAMDKWFCGAGDYDKTLSHQMSESDCPIRMYEANLCCLAHDLCYMEDDKTQNDCDSAFCFCLDRTVSKAASALNSTYTGGCDGVSSYFCMIVQIFGSSAHQSAKALRSSTTATTITSGAPTTTTASTSTEKSTTASSTTSKSTTTSTSATTNLAPALRTTKTPAEIAQFITHNVSLKCFDYGLSTCVEEMHSCMQLKNAESSRLLDEPRLSRRSAHIKSAIRSESESRAIAECASQFCLCSSLAFQKKAPAGDQKSCASGLTIVCNKMSVDGSSKERLNVHFWTINIEYLSQDFTSMTAILGVVCIFLIMASMLYLIRKIYRCNQRSSNAHIPTTLRPTDLGFGPWQRRQKRDSKSGYCSFPNKQSDASGDSGTRNSAVGDCCMSKQHLHAPHRHHHSNAIPTSSSKVQLISPDDNSSSSASTPSINSNE